MFVYYRREIYPATVHFVKQPGLFCFLQEQEEGVGWPLFRPDGLNLLPFNPDLDAEWRAQVRPLHDRPAHPDVSRQIGELERVKDAAVARISDHGVFGAAKAVFVGKLGWFGDVL